jgi:hypothetical protein
MLEQTKAAVSVAEMARMVGLSRQRFYQLMGSTFPRPIYDVSTKRPFYPEELQQTCLEVRLRNCGIDGKPVLFYAKGHRQQPRKTIGARKRATIKKKEFAGIVDGLTALGIFGVTDDQVAAAIKTVFPDGIHSTDQADVLRAVFLHLKRQDSSDKVGR